MDLIRIRNKVSQYKCSELHQKKEREIPWLVGCFIHIVIAVSIKIISIVEVGVNVVIFLSEGIYSLVNKVTQQHS